MKETIVSKVNPNELVNLINEGIKKQLEEISIQLKTKETPDKPHLTRKEAKEFFDVSYNCLNDWRKKGILKPYKVGQRTYYKRSDVMQVMFNSKKV